MNLKRVEKGSSPVLIYCCSCHTMRLEVECYADLDGKPFKSYYCQECAENVGPKQVDGFLVYGRI